MNRFSNVSIAVGSLLACVCFVQGSRDLLASCNAQEYRQYDCYKMTDATAPTQYFKTECISVYDTTSDGTDIRDCTPTETRRTRTVEGTENTDCNPVQYPTIGTCSGDVDWVESVVNRKCCYTPDE